MLLGRSAVLERADALLDGLREGRGGLLWLRGDAGIGKSSVLAEIGVARSEPGRPCSAARRPTRLPERPRSGSGPRSAPGRAGDPRALVALGGPRARRAADLVDSDAAAEPDPTGNRFPLFDGVQAVLDGLAAEFPVVLLLDDRHWADAGSLRLLRFLVPGLANRPVLVACGWRDHELPPGPPRSAGRGSSPPRVSPGPWRDSDPVTSPR